MVKRILIDTTVILLVVAGGYYYHVKKVQAVGEGAFNYGVFVGHQLGVNSTCKDA